MAEAFLRVTHPVLAERKTQPSQTQIAVRGATGHLAKAVASATRTNVVDLHVGGVFPLRLGNSGALWRKHQTTTASLEAFDRLFALLSLYPGQWVRFSM